MKYIVFALLSAIAFAGSAQSTQKLSASKANDYGIVYRLPVTTFEITLEAEGVLEKPGEFAQYARIYLNADPILKPSTRWTLRSAMITPTSEPDPAEEYLVQFKSGANTFMTLDAQSRPLAVNLADVPVAAAVPSLPVARQPEPTILDSEYSRQAVTADMASATSLAKRAELAAARIFEIRETRSEILSGQSDNMPNDGAAMKLVLDNLAKQEEALTAMFVGTRQSATQVVTVPFNPPLGLSADDSQRDIIARLSAVSGFVDPADLSGAPVYLTITVDQLGALPLTEKGEPRKLPKGAVAYRIPGSASLVVQSDGRTFASGKYPIAQYGVVYGVDPAIFTDKKAPSYLIFDPLTGAAREIGTVTE